LIVRGGGEQNDLTQNDLTQNDLTQNGLRQNGLTQNGLTQNSLTQNSLTQNSLTQNYFARYCGRAESLAECFGKVHWNRDVVGRAVLPKIIRPLGSDGFGGA